MIHHSSSRTTTLLAVYHYNWPLRYAVVVTLKLAHLAANARVLKPFVPAFSLCPSVLLWPFHTSNEQGPAYYGLSPQPEQTMLVVYYTLKPSILLHAQQCSLTHFPLYACVFLMMACSGHFAFLVLTPLHFVWVLTCFLRFCRPSRSLF